MENAKIHVLVLIYNYEQILDDFFNCEPFLDDEHNLALFLPTVFCSGQCIFAPAAESFEANKSVL